MGKQKQKKTKRGGVGGGRVADIGYANLEGHDRPEKNTKKKKGKDNNGKQKRKNGGSTTTASTSSNEFGGPSSTMDDYTFRQSLELSKDKTIIEMPADGNCLFRSLSDQLYGDYGRQHYDLVRQQICDYMSTRESDFKNFLVLDDRDAQRVGEEDASSYQDYIHQMRMDGEWGGNVELVAASRLYKRNITVYNPTGAFSIEWCDGDSSTADHNDSDYNNYGDHDTKYRRDEESKTLSVSYHEGDHYNSVRIEGRRPLMMRPSSVPRPPRRVDPSTKMFSTKDRSGSAKGNNITGDRTSKTSNSPSSLTEPSFAVSDSPTSSSRSVHSWLNENEKSSLMSSRPDATTSNQQQQQEEDEALTRYVYVEEEDDNCFANPKVKSFNRKSSSTASLRSLVATPPSSSGSRHHMTTINVDDRRVVHSVSTSSNTMSASHPQPKQNSIGSKKSLKQTTMIRRNDSCPCGSNLRYKKCCQPKLKLERQLAKIGIAENARNSISSPPPSDSVTLDGEFRVLKI